MGLRNPFRFDGRPEDRTRSTWPTTRRTPRAPNPARGPAGHGPLDGHRQAGQLRLAVLRRRRHCRTSTTTSPPADVGRRRSTAPRRSTTRRTTPACRGCRRSQKPEIYYSYGAVGGVPRAGRPAASARWPARRTTTTRRNRSRIKWPRVLRRQAAVLRVDPRLRQGALARPPRRGTSTSRPVLPAFVFDNPMDMEFGPDGALYVLEYGDGFFAENPDAQLARIDFVRGNRTPIAGGQRDAAGRAGAADGARSPARERPTRTATPCVRVGLRRATAGSTRARRTRRYTYTGERRLPADAEGHRLHRPVGVGRGAARRSAPIAPVVDVRDARRGAAVRVRRHGRLRGERARRRAGRLLAGHRGRTSSGTTSTGTRSRPRPGCTGTITTFVDPATARRDDLAAVFVATYTDAPSDPGTPPQTGTAEVVLFPGEA